MKISFSDDEKQFVKSIGTFFKSGAKIAADATVAAGKTAAKAAVTVSKVAVKATAATASVATKGIAETALYVNDKADKVNSAISIDAGDFGLQEDAVEPEVLHDDNNYVVEQAEPQHLEAAPIEIKAEDDAEVDIKLMKMIFKMHKKGLSEDEIAECLDVDKEIVLKVLED